MGYLRTHLFSILLLSASVLASCNAERPDGPSDACFIFEAGLAPVEKTTLLKADATGTRKLVWSPEDRICLNGVSSYALGAAGAGGQSARFGFAAVIKPPFSALYPHSAFRDASTITLPKYQNAFGEDGVADGALPMIAYAESASEPAVFRNLCAVVKVNLTWKSSSSGRDTDRLKYVEFSSSASGVQVSGDFAVDYRSATLSSLSSSSGDRIVRTRTEIVPSAVEKSVLICVPAADYSKGFEITVVDANGHSMTRTASARSLAPGSVYSFPTLEFIPTFTRIESDILQENTVSGKVLDLAGNPLADVVVSDGLTCVKTSSDGSYSLETDPSRATMVFASCPSGYFPLTEGNLPVFHRFLRDCPREGGVIRSDFVFERINGNADRYSLFLSADIQTYTRTTTYDNLAYHSLDVAEDIYSDWADYYKEKAARGRVYGIHMGDITSEYPSLHSEYKAGLARQQFPTFNVIGNHDVDLDDVGTGNKKQYCVGVNTFERLFGPVNCSFNIGKFHYIICNDIVFPAGADGKRNKDDHVTGLTDETWNWIQSDLSFVDRNMKIMFCAHGPIKGRTGDHINELRALLSQFEYTHCWFGHVHSVNFEDDDEYANIEYHTVGRTTGTLRYSEWNIGGIPRGYVVVDVDGGNLSWYYKPIAYQTAAYIGRYGPEPDRSWRPFEVVDGLAVKDGRPITPESLQFSVYPPASNAEGNIWLNVYLYDSHWTAVPRFQPEGSSSSYVFTRKSAYDVCAAAEYAHYKSVLPESTFEFCGYSNSKLSRMFYIKPAATIHGGTVSVTDRFGRVWTQKITW